MRRRAVLGLVGGAAAAAACGLPRRSAGPARLVTPSGPATPTTPVVIAPPHGQAPTHALDVTSANATFGRTGRKLPTIIHYPTAAGRYPGIVFGHGLGGFPEAYGHLLSSWAAAGFIVAAPRFPHTSLGTADFDAIDVVNQPADMMAALTGLLAHPVGRNVDSAHVAAAGHSAGAITTYGVFTTEGGHDTRFTAGVILAGNSLGVGTTFVPPAVPLLFVHSDHDPIVPYDAGRAAYAAAPEPKEFLTLHSNEHTEPYIDPYDHSYPLVLRVTTDFLRSTLYADTAAAARLRHVSNLERKP